MADTAFPANTDVLARDILRTWVKENARTGNFVKTGFAITDGGGLNASISAGTAVVEGVYLNRDIATTLGPLSASNTNHVFLSLDEAALDTVTITANTTGTAPSTPYIKLGTVLTGGASITSITQHRANNSALYDVRAHNGVTQAGEFVAEGYAQLATTTFTPGFRRFSAKEVVPLTGYCQYSPEIAYNVNSLGFKHSWKGRFYATSSTRHDSAFEKFGVGLAIETNWYAGGSTYPVRASFGHATATTRDDIITIGVVVDSADAVQKYNNVVGDSAAYTSAALTVAPTIGIWWEIIIDVPASTTLNSHPTVTIKINETTVHSAVASGSGAAITNIFPVVLGNLPGYLDCVTYKVARL